MSAPTRPYLTAYETARLLSQDNAAAAQDAQTRFSDLALAPSPDGTLSETPVSERPETSTALPPMLLH